ncbi:MAG: hypothetical protein ACKOEO_12295 [Planctomycetaceae bacterium]
MDDRRVLGAVARVLPGCLLLAMFGVAGCETAPTDVPKVPLHPVTGTIHLDGKPIAGARLALHAIQGAKAQDITPTGVTDDNGQFQISTYQPMDGAPEGSWSVTVSWPEVLSGGSDPEYGRARLPVRYQDPEKSGLVIASSEDLRDPVVLELKGK